jgi:hypothetical membrane protein
MKKSNPIAWVLSILVVAVYLVMTTLALLRYPVSFSPGSNWLSDLGNRIISPDGSAFYNAGIFITGSLLALFFISLGSTRIPGRKVQNIMLLLTQICGASGSIAMIMTGVFSIDTPQTHSLFSEILRIGLGSAFGFSVAAFRYQNRIKKWILVAGVITTLTDLIVSVFYNKTQILEWPVIALFLIYCLLLGNETYRLGRVKQENV